VSLLEQFLDSEEFKRLALTEFFVPPGHFYSPIVDRTEAEAQFARITSEGIPESVPGITIDRNEMRQTWQKLVQLMVAAPFAELPANGLMYGFNNPYYGWGDGSVLYGMVRHYRPNRVIEVGSGWSSACMVDTVETSTALKCEFTFIEPYPSPLLRELVARDLRFSRVRLIDHPVQCVPYTTFSELQSGDILFIDSSHILKTGSDVCYELFDILPRLSKGVLVHFHDMFWPFEYPEPWVMDENRSWNELYAVRAFLTNNHDWRVVLFNDFLRHFERPLIEATYPAFYRSPGGALWIERTDN